MRVLLFFALVFWFLAFCGYRVALGERSDPSGVYLVAVPGVIAIIVTVAYVVSVIFFHRLW